MDNCVLNIDIFNMKDAKIMIIDFSQTLRGQYVLTRDYNTTNVYLLPHFHASAIHTHTLIYVKHRPSQERVITVGCQCRRRRAKGNQDKRNTWKINSPIMTRFQTTEERSKNCEIHKNSTGQAANYHPCR